MQFAVPISKCVYIHSYGYIGPRGYTQLWMLSPLLLPMWISTAAPSDFHDDPPIIQLLVDVHPGGWFDMIYPPFQAIPDCLLMLPQTYQKNYGPMGHSLVPEVPLAFLQAHHLQGAWICGSLVEKALAEPSKTHPGFSVLKFEIFRWQEGTACSFHLVWSICYLDFEGLLQLMGQFSIFFRSPLQETCQCLQPNGIMGHLNSNTALHGTTHLLLYIMLDPD